MVSTILPFNGALLVFLLLLVLFGVIVKKTLLNQGHEKLLIFFQECYSSSPYI